MNNYFYNLPVELQEYIFDINKYHAILNARTAIRKKAQYIQFLINDLLNQNDYIMNPVTDSPTIYGLMNPISPNSSFTVRILKIIDKIIINDNYIYTILKKNPLIPYDKWNRFLWCLQGGLWEQQYDYNYNNNYTFTETMYHIFRAQTIHNAYYEIGVKLQRNDWYTVLSPRPPILNNEIHDIVSENIYDPVNSNNPPWYYWPPDEY